MSGEESWSEPGWYDRGGFLNIGWSHAHNSSGKPEMVSAADQIRHGLDYIREHYRDEDGRSETFCCFRKWAGLPCSHTGKESS